MILLSNWYLSQIDMVGQILIGVRDNGTVEGAKIEGNKRSLDIQR